jgi:hypothetical protein
MWRALENTAMDLQVNIESWFLLEQLRASQQALRSVQLFSAFRTRGALVTQLLLVT